MTGQTTRVIQAAPPPSQDFLLALVCHPPFPLRHQNSVRKFLTVHRRGQTAQTSLQNVCGALGRKVQELSLRLQVR